ncbi:hypothetical protein AB9N12_18510 [Bacteroides sp. AN502(2024)]|uniref:hypothetical protein n=1 Tax=Bacteroides sp. AN502(2024) TaxID=3160599 RepID=UPI0035190498
MKKYIHVTKEDRHFLAQAFGVSDVTVWKALKYEQDTNTIRKIQFHALQRGGILMIVSPAMETMHDVDGYMRQYFPNGVMLECDKNTGRVDIIKDGKPVKNYKNVMLNQFPAIQAEAQNL